MAGYILRECHSEISTQRSAEIVIHITELNFYESEEVHEAKEKANSKEQIQVWE